MSAMQLLIACLCFVSPVVREPAEGVKHMDKVKEWEADLATQKRYAKAKATEAAAAAAAAAAGTKDGSASAAASASATAASAPVDKALPIRDGRLPITAPKPSAPASFSSVAPVPASAFSPKALTCLPPAPALTRVTSTSTTPKPPSAEPLSSTAVPVAGAASATAATPIVKPSPSKPAKRKIDAVDSNPHPIEPKGKPAVPAAHAAASDGLLALSAAVPPAAAASASSALPSISAAPNSSEKKRIKKFKLPSGTAAAAPAQQASGNSKAVSPHPKRHKQDKQPNAKTKTAAAGRESIDLTD